MIHYLLLKFEQGYFTQDVFRLAADTFESLKEELPGITAVQVIQNSVCRSSNADLMVRMELSDQEMLYTYLNHPLHQRFAQQVSPHLVQKASFDQEQSGPEKELQGAEGGIKAKD